MKHNKVTWFSIPSDDIKRATAFYQKVFDWKVEPLTKEDNDVFSYHVVVNSEGDSNYVPHEKGTLNGCIVKREIGLPTPAVLIEVNDLDVAIEKVKQAGGELVTGKNPMKSLQGEFVLVKDTEGNYVELFTSI
jgi:predicted enzyme related to lactoylglutathione lyase